MYTCVCFYTLKTSNMYICMHIQQRQGRFRNRVGRREEKGKGGCGQGEIFQKSILLLCCVVEFEAC